MSLNFSKPSALLEPYIKQYWMVQNNLASGHRYSHRIVPSGLMELSFYLGSKPVVVKSKESRRSDRTLLTGQLLNFYEVEISETLDLFSITFQPQGAMRFFELPLSELSNQTIAWKEVFSGSIRQVEEQLYEANSFHERVRIADAFLYKKLMTNLDCRNFDRINNSVRKIDLTKGKVSIDKLASDACLSRKQFERNFTSGIGIPPKQFLKVVRFQHAIYQKQLSPDLNLTRLALDSGYYDQSHMINDFRTLSGNSPSEYFRNCTPYSDYFSF
jgi:AraC-like DNA-binding protein